MTCSSSGLAGIRLFSLGLWLALCNVQGCDGFVVIGRDPVALGDRNDAAMAPIAITWPTGVHAGNLPQDYLSFAEFRGRELDVAMFFVDRTVGWPGLIRPGWPVDMLADLPARLILAMPLYPEGTGTTAACAVGEYDEQWRQLGPFLAQRGRGDTIIRLGWGPNDEDHDWRVDGDTQAWVQCYRRVVQAIRSAGPAIEIAWDFDMDGQPGTTGLDPYSAYPGDGYVDYVGVEAFDRFSSAFTEEEWMNECQKSAGLCHLLAFARARGKRVGISEWGGVSCGQGAAGDNARFVRRVVGLFADNADIMGFEAYYEDSGELCSGLQGQTAMPQAAAAYRQLYRMR